jgi:hypothetical protein
MPRTLSCDQYRSLNAESLESVPCSKPDRAPRTARWDLFVIRESLTFQNLQALLCRWYAGFRSFRGHIALLTPRMGGWVQFPAFGKFLDEHRDPHEETIARVEGIKTLGSKYPWTDAVDIRMFLMGFDAGERYSMDRLACRIPAEQHTPIELGSCDQLSQVPDVGTDTSGHSGSHAQG